MKALRLSLLTAAVCSTAAFSAPAPADLAGTYHALLCTGNDITGSPAGLAILTVTNKGAVTGKLTTHENKTYAFKTTLDYTAETEVGSKLGTAINAAEITISRGKVLSALTLNLKINDLTDTDTLEVTLNEPDAANRVATKGFKTIVFPKGQSSPAAGPYTAAFKLADAPTPNVPAGSGYAVATVDAKGALKLTGKTGDGAAITGSFPSGPNKQYAIFLNPYKRVDSSFAGNIQLTAREDGKFHMLPATTGFDIQWKKASLLPKTTDKSYREQFGPVDVLVSLEPWTAPGKGISVGTTLGIDTTEVFPIAYDGVFPGSAYAKYMPIKAGLTEKNTLRITVGGTGSSAGANQDLWAKIITTKIDPKTGKFSATLNIEDSILVASRPKTVKRKVIFEGVFLQLAEGDSSSFVQGQIIVPPLDPKTGTTTVSAFEFQGTITVDTLYAEAAATAGTYKTILVRQPNEAEDTDEAVIPYATGTPTPYTGANVTFTIARDLQSINFAGKALPVLPGSISSTSISFTNATTGSMNKTTVICFLDGSKRVYSVFAEYNQFGVSGRTPFVRVSNYLSRDNNVTVKQ